MSITQMAFREIWGRKVTFLLAAGGVALAAATIVGAQAFLEIYRLRSDALLARKEAEVKQRLAVLQDEMRKAALKLSFNMAILPMGQDLRAWHEQDYGNTYMPEDYVNRLAKSGIVSVQHLLPILATKTRWPEMKRTIILVGCRGEVPQGTKNTKAPLMQPVPPGRMVVGHELWRSLDLKVGQTVRLMGREFVIHKCQEERGSKDDIGVWIPLKDAQELLDKPGQLNAILALQCLCVGRAGFARVRADVAAALPDTKVVEFETKVLARSEARTRVAEEAVQAVEREKASRTQLQAERAQAAAAAVPAVCLACGAWVFLMALINARGRRSEVGILRAIGYRAHQILALFLLRYLLGGVVGAVLGISAAVLAAAAVGRGGEAPLAAGSAGLSWEFLGGTLVMASLLSLVAGWIPALLAARQDPARTLVEA